jgi:hypothetical protein
VETEPLILFAKLSPEMPAGHLHGLRKWQSEMTLDTSVQQVRSGKSMVVSQQLLAEFAPY